MPSSMGSVTLVGRNILHRIMAHCDHMSMAMDVGVFSVFAVVGLYGLYCMLFAIAVWSTYQEASVVSRRMRMLAFVMCFIVTLHTMVEIVNFCIWRPPQDATQRQLPMKFYVMPIIEKLTPCLAGILSDGFLAWRCWVIWGKKNWMLWLLPTLVLTNSALGLFSNIAFAKRFALLRQNSFDMHDSTDRSRQADRDADMASVIMLGWSWWFLLVNTAMTVSIIARISYFAPKESKLKQTSPYPTVIRAIIESSLVSWVGLLAYKIPYVLPHDEHGTNANAMAAVCSDTLFALLPLIFGISQTLIIARLGLTRFVAMVSGQPTLAISLSSAMQGPLASDCETGITIERGGRKGAMEKGWTESMDMDAIHRQLRAL